MVSQKNPYEELREKVSEGDLEENNSIERVKSAIENPDLKKNIEEIRQEKAIERALENAAARRKNKTEPSMKEDFTAKKGSEDGPSVPGEPQKVMDTPEDQLASESPRLTFKKMPEEGRSDLTQGEKQKRQEEILAAVDYYEALGVSKDASLEEIKKAHRLLVKAFHPDRNRSEEDVVRPVFEKIEKAYDTLSKPAKREAYNVELLKPLLAPLEKEVKTNDRELKRINQFAEALAGVGEIPEELKEKKDFLERRRKELVDEIDSIKSKSGPQVPADEIVTPVISEKKKPEPMPKIPEAANAKGEDKSTIADTAGGDKIKSMDKKIETTSGKRKIETQSEWTQEAEKKKELLQNLISIAEAGMKSVKKGELDLDEIEKIGDKYAKKGLENDLKSRALGIATEDKREAALKEAHKKRNPESRRSAMESAKKIVVEKLNSEEEDVYYEKAGKALAKEYPYRLAILKQRLEKLNELTSLTPEGTMAGLYENNPEKIVKEISGFVTPEDIEEEIKKREEKKDAKKSDEEARSEGEAKPEGGIPTKEEADEGTPVAETEEDRERKIAAGRKEIDKMWENEEEKVKSEWEQQMVKGKKMWVHESSKFKGEKIEASKAERSKLPPAKNLLREILGKIEDGDEKNKEWNRIERMMKGKRCYIADKNGQPGLYLKLIDVTGEDKEGKTMVDKDSKLIFEVYDRTGKRIKKQGKEAIKTFTFKDLNVRIWERVKEFPGVGERILLKGGKRGKITEKTIEDIKGKEAEAINNLRVYDGMHKVVAPERPVVAYPAAVTEGRKRRSAPVETSRPKAEAVSKTENQLKSLEERKEAALETKEAILAEIKREKEIIKNLKETLTNSTLDKSMRRSGEKQIKDARKKIEKEYHYGLAAVDRRLKEMDFIEARLKRKLAQKEYKEKLKEERKAKLKNMSVAKRIFTFNWW